MPLDYLYIILKKIDENPHVISYDQSEEMSSSIILLHQRIDLTGIFPDIPWDWEHVSKESDRAAEIAVKYPDKSWDWSIISRNIKNIEIIDEYPTVPWDWGALSHNRNLTMDLVIRHPDNEENLRWDWWSFAHNYDFNAKLLNIFPDRPWDWNYISQRAFFTFELLEAYPGKGWAWGHILREKCKSGVQLIRLIDIFLSLHRSEYEDHIFWTCASKSEFLTADIIEKYKGRTSRKMDLATMDDKTKEIIPWNWGNISSKAKLTANFAVKHADKLNLINLLDNRSIMEDNAAIKIQRCWRKHGSFPRWKKGIKGSNIAILYNPIAKGIKFKEAKEDWNNLISS